MKGMTVLFLRQEQEILLAMKKRGFGEGRWNGVGGKINTGEAPEQAAIRETQEEIIVTPTKIKKVAELIFNEMHAGIRESLLAHVYTCSEWEGTPTETEEMAPKWFTEEAIPYDQMWPDDIIWLPKVLGGSLIKGAFIFDSNDVVVKSDIREVPSQ